jgi:valyl-tRNA synthetase
VFAEETGHASIHRAPWPTLAELSDIAPPADAGSFDVAVAAVAAVNKAKSEGGVSPGRGVARLDLAAHPDTLATLATVERDVLRAARIEEWQLVPAADAAPGAFAVRDIAYVAPVEA